MLLFPGLNTCRFYYKKITSNPEWWNQNSTTQAVIDKIRLLHIRDTINLRFAIQSINSTNNIL